MTKTTPTRSAQSRKNAALRKRVDEMKIAAPVAGLKYSALVALPTLTSPQILEAALQHQKDRAAIYDSPVGERSMGQAVAAFNIITGKSLSESDGWLLMQVLKDVRDRAGPGPHQDSLEDCVSYAALKAESRLAGR